MKIIFWDFNGTVLDDVELCHDILNEMLIEEERPTVTLEDYLMIFEFPVRNYYAKVYDLEKTSFEVLADRFISKYQPRSLKLKLHDEVIETIAYFKTKGFLNILLSASEKENLIEQLKHFNLENVFDHILAIDNIHARSKVHIAQAFVKKHNLDLSNAILIGDTLHDAEVAEALKIDVVLYTKGHQHPSRLRKYENFTHFRELIGKIE
ncbi:MAG: HAD hydrolase-like protein [Acholeplasmataceae bacterium]